MAVSGLAVFFLQYTGTKVLDLLLHRISGDSAGYRGLEVDLSGVGAKQDQVLDKLDDQLEAQFSAGVNSIDYARNCDRGTSGYQANLRHAITHLNYCAHLKHFQGLRKAQIFVYLAVCQHLVDERRNAIQSLEEALKVAQHTAQERGEVYIREEASEQFQVTLPNGRVVEVSRWRSQTVPAIRDGALALSEEIKQGLAVVKQS